MKGWICKTTCKSLAKLKPKIKKLCVVRTYINIEEVVIVVVEIERVLGELGETPYEPIKEKQDETTFRESTTNQQFHVLNETFINFFGKGIDGKAKPNITFDANTNNHCQLCRSEVHIVSACPKLTDTRPKCAKCGGGHKINNCGLKCSFYFGLGHIEDKCSKKFAKGLPATTNFLEVLVDDEKATLAELNCVCGGDQHIFFEVRIPKRKLPIVANPTKEQEEVIAEEEQKGANMESKTVMKFKTFYHFIKGKISLTPMETILIIPGEQEYLKGLVKLARRRKYAQGQRS